MAGPAGKKDAEKSDIKVEQPSAAAEEAVTKKRGRPAKAAADKPTYKPSESVPKPAKTTEAGQEGKRPRGRPPGTGKKQKAAAEEAAAKEAIILSSSSMALVANCLKIKRHCLQAAMEGEGTASTNEDAEETAQPEQKKGEKKATKTAAS